MQKLHLQLQSERCRTAVRFGAFQGLKGSGFRGLGFRGFGD